jgi:hypothetical protein
MASRKIAYAASVDLTITLASLASSSTLVAGRESDVIDNSTNLYLDYLLAGMITTGTTPTVSKSIEVWVVPMRNDADWPDVFDGADSAETITSRDILFSHGRLAACMVVSATSNVGYHFGPVSVAALFGGRCPRKFAVFVVHDTAVNLNSTAGNHEISYTPVYETVA